MRAFGKNVRPYPGVIVRQLGFQFCERLFPTCDAVLLEERRNAVDEILIARKLRFDFHLRRINHVGLGDLFFGALLQNFGERFVARLDAGIFAQPHQRSLAALGRHLVVQQLAQPLKHVLARIFVRHFVGLAKIVTSEGKTDAVQ